MGFAQSNLIFSIQLSFWVNIITFTRFVTAAETAWTGRLRSGISCPASPSSWMMTNRDTWIIKACKLCENHFYFTCAIRLHNSSKIYFTFFLITSIAGKKPFPFQNLFIMHIYDKFIELLILIKKLFYLNRLNDHEKLTLLSETFLTPSHPILSMQMIKSLTAIFFQL